MSLNFSLIIHLKLRKTVYIFFVQNNIFAEYD